MHKVFCELVIDPCLIFLSWLVSILTTVLCAHAHVQKNMLSCFYCCLEKKNEQSEVYSTSQLRSLEFGHEGGGAGSARNDKPHPFCIRKTGFAKHPFAAKCTDFSLKDPIEGIILMIKVYVQKWNSNKEKISARNWGPIRYSLLTCKGS